MSKTSISLSIFSLLSLLSLSSSQEFTFLGFAGSSNGTTIIPDGIAAVDNDTGILRLTNETSRLIGHAFYPTPLRFKNSTTASSFSTAFAFAIAPKFSTLGGHGFAFVISPDKTLTGAQPSQYLGIFNASDNSNFTDHVFAVEFDTVQDFEFFDINDNHVGIDINNLHSNSSAAAAYYSDDGKRKTDINLISGDTIQAWVDYDGEKKTVNVTLSPFSTKPKVPLLSFSVDLSPVLLDEMYVGFSASTGLIASSHYLMGWSFKMNGAAQSLDLSSLPSLPKIRRTNVTLIVTVTLSAVIVLLAAVAAAAYLIYKIKHADVIEPWELEYGPHRFSYNELKHATKNFRDRDHLLGFGGFGKVYRGVLPGTKAEVAVKRVSHGSRQGLREFVAEIASIGRLRHRNLVRLQGWCRRRGDLLLVYDYMHNGSLDRYLFEESADHVLSWDERYRIIKGVASALLYLHEEWESVVIHRDVKASNVLLDIDMNGRLGDFGLAKLYEHGANPSTTRVVGTLGYLAPETTRTGKATASSDVFGFGALVLETICGRRPIEPKAAPEELVLVDLVWEKWSSGKWGEVVDRRLEGGFDIEEAEVGIKLGLLCSHPSGSMRPTMREVVRYLDGRDALEVPEVSLPPGEESVGPIGGSRGVAGKDGAVVVGSEVFAHSYPTSSSFENVGPSEEVVGSAEYSPLSRVSV